MGQHGMNTWELDKRARFWERFVERGEQVLLVVITLAILTCLCLALGANGERSL